MDTTVTLDKRHFKAASDTARKLGTTPQAYIQSLIDAANLSFDELLAPVRDGFRKSGVSESELDEVVTDARKAIYSKGSRQSRK